MRMIDRIVGSGTRLKVMVQGGVQNVQTAARIVGEGSADFIGFARPLLADPHLARKAQESRLDEIMPSVGSGECFWRSLDGLPTVCVHNPVTGREGRWGLDNLDSRAAEVHRVAVVGAGPTGLEAAATAANRGHQVTVFERSDSVGGHLKLEAALPHRARWHSTIAAFEKRAKKAGARILLNHEITVDSPELEGFDTVLVATGASWDPELFQAALPLVPRLPRSDESAVIGLDTAIERAAADPTSLGSSVVIVDEGGDYLPLGLADLLSSAGTKVRVVSASAAVGAHVSLVVDTIALERMAARDVELIPQVVVESYEAGTLTLIEGWSRRHRKITNVDTVVAGTFRKAQRSLYEGLVENYPDVRLIGDAAVPRRMPEAMADSHHVAFSI